MGFKESTPLHEAAIHEHIHCVRILMENGADATIRNSHGFTPRDFAMKNEEIFKIIDEKDLKGKLLDQSVITATGVSDDKLRDEHVGAKPKKRIARVIQKKFVVFGTGMSDEEKKRLSELASKLELKLVKEMSNSGS